MRSAIKRRSPYLSLLLLTAVMLLSGVAGAQFTGPALGNDATVNRPTAITTDPALLFPADRPLLLKAGDSLSVRIYGAADYTIPVRVSINGSIDLPLAGNLQVEGLTVHEAEKVIAERMIALKMYVDPQVSIQVLESPNSIVTVTGEVHGVIPILGKKRLFDALAAAGGIPNTASHVVTIQRPGLDAPLVVDLGTDPGKSAMSNVPVFAGDTVIVSRVGVIYVIGAFKSQNAYPINGSSPLTLMQSLSLAGGVNFEGKREDARVIRTIGTKRVEVKTNVARIMAGKDPDPVLQADDIVYVPTSTLKAAIRSGGIATLIGISSFITYSAGVVR